MDMEMKTVTMPALALRGLTVFPNMLVHFDVGREASIRALDEAMRDQQDAQAVMFRGLLSLINHQLSGNGVDKLRDARDEIQKYLTGR